MLAHANRTSQRLDFFFAELCVPNIYIQEWKKKSIVDFSIQWYHSNADLTGLYIYVKCKMNFKEHTKGIHYWKKTIYMSDLGYMFN
jgi:hypothetical protein